MLKKPRKCGTCTACCTTHGVPELEKPHATPCDKLCAKGCSIYGKHPESCRGFECLWLHGAFEGAQRPDRLGIVFDCTEPTNGVQSMVAREYREGALDTMEATTLLDYYSSKLVVLIFDVKGKGRAVRGPRHLVNKALGR